MHQNESLVVETSPESVRPNRSETGRSTRQKSGRKSFVPTLVKTRSTRLGVLLDLIHEFEDAIEIHTDWKTVNGPALPRRRLPLFLISILVRILRFVRRFVPLKSKKCYLSIGYLSPSALRFKAFPYFDLPARFRILWAYDVWDNGLWPETLESIEEHDVKLVFVSSRQGTDLLKKNANGRCECYWLPEAIDLDRYYYRPMFSRRIDVVQFGRRWDEYHYRIEKVCRDNSLIYVYEKEKGKLIFPSRNDFVDALADTRISICVPSSITHPERSGSISTMTSRYLESMASKCLVLGRMPPEMKEIFDYDPVIEIDMSRPGDQLLELLNELPRYEELIERNYQYVRRHHQWKNRIATMQECFSDFERRHPEWV